MFCYRNNCGCNSCGCDRRGYYGQRGPAGPQGPTGTVSNLNATIYNGTTQAITTNTPLTLPTTLTNTGITTTTNSAIIPTSGTYLINYGVNSATDAITGDYVGVAINGIIIPATERLLTTTNGTNGAYVLNLNAGDVVTLVPVVTGATNLSGTGGPSAYLTMSHIA